MMILRGLWQVLLASLMLCVLLRPSWAHQNSTSYLSLSGQGQQLQGSYALALRDVALLLPLDRNGNQQIEWGELRDAQPQWDQLLAQTLRFGTATQRCQLRSSQPLWLQYQADQLYVWQPIQVQCASPASQLDYRMLVDLDSNHRLLISREQHSSIAAAGLIPLPQAAAWYSSMAAYLQSGFHHLLIGADHLLFLACLLLPLVYRAQKQTALRPVYRQTIWIASAFTLAHSITLALAALQWVHLPVRLIETAIAATIAYSAIANFWPQRLQHQARWAFGFGLIHGFGFANVLADLPLERSDRVLALLSFNLGIELAQLACVLVVLPLLLAVRQRAGFVLGYRVACASMALLALYWVVERAVMT